MNKILEKAEDEAWEILFGECSVQSLPAQIEIYLDSLSDFSDWEIAQAKRVLTRSLYKMQYKKQTRVFNNTLLNEEARKLLIDKNFARQLCAWVLLFGGLSKLQIVDKINQKFMSTEINKKIAITSGFGIATFVSV